MQQVFKTLIILVGIGSLLGGAGIGYYYGVVLPEAEEKYLEQVQDNQAKNNTCINKAKENARQRYMKTCELIKEEKTLDLKDCKKPSPLTGTRFDSDEYCESLHGYREESPGLCVGNKYAPNINIQLNNAIMECDKNYPIKY